MPIIEDSFPQNSDEWFQARLGNPGASSMNKIITSTGSPSKQATEYVYQLAGEYITGKHEETFKSLHMEIGLQREKDARIVFELTNMIDVRQVGLVYKDEARAFHASVDGLVGDNGGLEIKCPMMKTHIKYLLENKLPTDYFVQVQSSLYICELEKYWFMSYYPGLDPFILQVYRDEKFISKLKAELEAFCFELAGLIRKLKGAS